MTKENLQEKQTARKKPSRAEAKKLIKKLAHQHKDTLKALAKV